ncbi:hypothetical protein llap_6520 [Limosa lapponica baueri]|uniref:Uncharacterized protein n=1 Tax=Limosa lapponica baueri TaxID=1758121 RepID=A0A2I0UAV9_LIMLA|nr:hypothetical protein llap_6520 [Limosa lapponica baueri]
MTQTAAKVSADGLPAASRPYKEQLWEAKDIPGNSPAIRGKSSSAKISSTGLQTRVPQSFLIRERLQPLDHLCSPPLDSFQQFLVFLELGAPEPDRVLQMWPHQGRGEGEDDLLRPAGHALSKAPQETIGRLGHEDTLLAHGQLAVHQDTELSLSSAAFQQVTPKTVLVYRVIPPEVQGPTLTLIELH